MSRPRGQLSPNVTGLHRLNPSQSPLRTATIGGRSAASAHGLPTADVLAAEVTQPREAIPAPQLRPMQISDFTDWLRSRTNKHHRPFQADTIAAYCHAARALSEWMSGHDVNGDFIA